jgi:hypothetical protein
MAGASDGVDDDNFVDLTQDIGDEPYRDSNTVPALVVTEDTHVFVSVPDCIDYDSDRQRGTLKSSEVFAADRDAMACYRAMKVHEC